jgi:hypothetical protein
MRRVLERPEAVDIDPEWLRDRVEDLFTRRDWARALVNIDRDAVEEEGAFLSTLNQILPKAVDQILDEIVRRKGDQKR